MDSESKSEWLSITNSVGKRLKSSSIVTINSAHHRLSSASG